MNTQTEISRNITASRLKEIRLELAKVALSLFVLVPESIWMSFVLVYQGVTERTTYFQVITVSRILVTF